MQQRGRIVVPILALALMAACSDGGTEASNAGTASTAPADSAAPSPSEVAEISAAPSASSGPSEAATAEFAVSTPVPFSLTAPSGWSRATESSGATTLIDAGMDRWIAVTLNGPDTVDAWVEQLTTPVQLEAGEPEAVEIGGASGFVLDVTTSEEAAAGGAGACASATAERCWQLYTDAQHFWSIDEGRPNRVWVLDVDGETVLIVTDSPERAFDTWADSVGEALTTLEWGE
jgi:hypothetical protein